MRFWVYICLKDLERDEPAESRRTTMNLNDTKLFFCIWVPIAGEMDSDLFIAYCGLDCETCEARLATVNDDNELRSKVAREWSELNSVEITPEMINCSGCRIDGVKTPYCDSLCPIRQCAREKKMETCGGCPEMESCEKVGAIIGNNSDARGRLENTGYV